MLQLRTETYNEMNPQKRNRRRSPSKGAYNTHTRHGKPKQITQCAYSILKLTLYKQKNNSNSKTPSTESTEASDSSDVMSPKCVPLPSVRDANAQKRSNSVAELIAKFKPQNNIKDDQQKYKLRWVDHVAVTRGLPQSIFGAHLAHEFFHCYLFLTKMDVASDVIEEGMCNFIAASYLHYVQKKVKKKMLAIIGWLREGRVPPNVSAKIVSTKKLNRGR